MEYPKINSLYKREQDKKKNLIMGDYACPEFSSIKRWRVDEKIDGTNVRIFYRDDKISFGGRTKDSQMPIRLLDYLSNSISGCLLLKAFNVPNDKPYPNAILFGEGYGPKIQKGGENYREDVGFILFDVWVEGWWLKREDVKDIAQKLMIPVVPDLGIMTEDEIIEFVKSKPLSRCSHKDQIMEGVVCRSDPQMLFRDGKPIMWKLKVRDFHGHV